MKRKERLRVTEEREKQTYVELDAELLILAAGGGDHNSVEVMRRIGEMKPEERRVLRRALERLDSALDEVTMTERIERPRKDRRGG
jgi:hypothetical protein